MELGGDNNGSGNQDGSNYVIDPYFTQKTEDAAKKDDFESEWFGTDKAYAGQATTYNSLPTTTDHSLLDYCMENTMPMNSQLNGYTTGIVFKATYAPEKVLSYDAQTGTTKEVDYNPGDSFYRYAGLLYKDKKSITDQFTGVESHIEEYVGDRTTGATCYYKYWIKHQDNGLSEQMGIMEFAIVRNNAYKLSISKVSGIGEPTDVIDPENPDETSEMYLTVKVTILPWVVRNNEGIIL